MIPFTLYCFAKVFNLSYTGATSRMSNFFQGDNTADALTKVVCGKTDGPKYAERIDVENPRAFNTLKSVSTDRLRFVYQSIIKEHPEGKSKEELISPLLEYALLQDKEIQADVYSRRKSDEVKDFISRLKNLSLPPDTTAVCAEPESSHDAHTVSHTTDSNDTVRVDDADFQRFIEEHVDKVSSFLICCHISANWLKPSSPRFHLLRALCERNVQVRVIMNTSEAIREIYPHMVDREAYEMKMYRTIDQVAETWKAFSASKPSLTVKRSALPILHTLTVCEFQGDLQPIMRTTLYAYGNPLLEDHPHLVFHKDDAYYNVLRNEFEYLWEHAEPFNE